jgi:hypothetical protein
VRSLPVLMGVNFSRWGAPAAVAAAGVLAAALAGPLHQAGVPFFAGIAVLVSGVVVVVVTRARRPFPILAIVTAVFAVTWLGSLPAS